MTARWLGLALALTLSVNARADDVRREEARRLTQIAQAASARGDHAIALEHFEGAYRFFPSPNLRFNVGLVLMKLNRPSEAAAAFDDFLDAAKDAPTDIRAYATARLDAAKKLVGTLAITTSAAGAQISIDDRAHGTAPLRHSIYLAPGKHTLLVTNEGSLPFKSLIDVAAGSFTFVNAELTAPRPGQLEARRLKDMAQLASQQGKYAIALEHFESAYRFFPSPNLRFNIGLTLIKLGRPVLAATALRQFLTESPDAPADARRYAEEQLDELRKSVGQIAVLCKQSGATVRLDGTPVGAIPLGSSVFVSPGEHEITVHKSGFVDSTQRVSVAIGGVELVDVQLLTEKGAARQSTWRRYRAPILVGIAALAIAGAGTGLVVTALPEYNDLKRDATSNPSTGISMLNESLASRARDLQVRAYVGYGLWGLAGAVAIVDFALFGIAAKSAAKERRVSWSPTPGGLLVHGTF